MYIYGTKLNHQVNPIIEDGDFNFSWKIGSQENASEDFEQTSYQISIRDENTLIWNSQPVKSYQTINNKFENIPVHPNKKYYWQVEIKNDQQQLLKSTPQSFFTAASWQDIGVISAGNKSSLPVFTRKFDLKQEPTDISSAIMYISGLGTYDVLINNQDILNNNDQTIEILNPGWTDYHTQINYQAYDVKDNLSSENVLKIPIGKGYFLGKIAQFSNYEDLFTDKIKKPLLIFKMIITYQDGTEQLVTTSDIEKWDYYDQNEHVDNDIYNGEVIDFSRSDSNLQPAFTPDIDQIAFRNKLSPSHGAKAYEFLDRKYEPVTASNYKPAEVIDSNSLPLGEVKLTDVTDKEWHADQKTRLLFDFGQNMAATLLVTFNSESTTPNKIKFRTGEILNDGLGNPEKNTGSDGPKNSLHHRNLISEIGGDAKSEEVFLTSDQKEHSYNAKWTFHGFRYVQVEADGPVNVHSIYQVPVSSMTKKTADLKTNNPDVNRLIKNIQFGEQSNYLSIPIDSPNRAERAGWTADAQVFARSGLLGFDSTSFLSNYLKVINNTADGSSYRGVMPKSFSPQLDGTLISGWSDIGITLPWQLYKFTGDTSYISDYYSQMDEYMHTIGDIDDVETNYDEHIFCDWLGFAPASTPFMNIIYRAYTTKLMEKMSQIIGNKQRTNEYHHLFVLIKNYIQEKYVSVENHQFKLLTKTADKVDKSIHGYNFVDNSETGLLWFLKLQLFSDEQQKKAAISALNKVIENRNQSVRPNMPEKSLSVGFLGINVLLPELSDSGLDNLAYDLLLSDQNPSWLLAVKNGATTLWERWDSYTKERGISPDSMNSFNHYSYVSIAEWLYSTMLGIKVDPTSDHGNIVIEPVIDRGNQYNNQARITKVNGSIESIYGKISINWESNGKVLTHLNVSVPINAKATLKLDTENAKILNLIDEKQIKNNIYEIHLNSGKHDFK